MSLLKRYTGSAWEVVSGATASTAIQALGNKGTNFSVDYTAGGYVTFTPTAAVSITLTSPASSTTSYRLVVEINQGGTAYTVTLLGTDANVISSGGLMSSSKALSNSGASTTDIFEFKWNGAKWVAVNALYDVKA